MRRTKAGKTREPTNNSLLAVRKDGRMRNYKRGIVQRTLRGTGRKDSKLLELFNLPKEKELITMLYELGTEEETQKHPSL